MYQGGREGVVVVEEEEEKKEEGTPLWDTDEDKGVVSSIGPKMATFRYFFSTDTACGPQSMKLRVLQPPSALIKRRKIIGKRCRSAPSPLERDPWKPQPYQQQSTFLFCEPARAGSRAGRKKPPVPSSSGSSAWRRLRSRLSRPRDLH